MNKGVVLIEYRGQEKNRAERTRNTRRSDMHQTDISKTQEQTCSFARRRFLVTFSGQADGSE